MRSIIVAGLLLAIPNSSYGQKVQVIGELSVGYTTAGGELGSSDLPFHTQIGGGVRVGDISLELFGDWKTFTPERSDLHSEAMVDLSLGTQLRWFVNNSDKESKMRIPLSKLRTVRTGYSARS